MRTRIHAAVAKDEERARAAKRTERSPPRGKEKDAKSTLVELELQQVRSRPRWCPANLKGNCQMGDVRPYPHLDEEAVSRIKSSDKRRKELEKEKNSEKTEERGRSPSRDKKGKKWRKGSAGSE